jgi:L-galactono-1,4-lactone dehydrogenase
LFTLVTCRKDNHEADVNELSFTELRDKLLALDPLNKDHVIKVNQAEAEFWRKSEGFRVGWSDEILGFDCGGQQWVSETCFPAGTLAKPSMKDLEFIEELKQLIEKEEIPAPAPIEQRWTARSKSAMSPASSLEEDDIFSWVISIASFFFPHLSKVLFLERGGYGLDQMQMRALLFSF